MKYSTPLVEKLFLENQDRAISLLSGLPIANGRAPSFQGLNGWIFEQTIHHCLEVELSILGIHLTILDQQSLKGRAKVDLLIGNTAVELKVGGWFGDESEKYKKYRAIAAEQQRHYVYLSRLEEHAPYRKTAESTFGKGNAFFLSDGDSIWRQFVERIAANNKR